MTDVHRVYVGVARELEAENGLSALGFLATVPAYEIRPQQPHSPRNNDELPEADVVPAGRAPFAWSSDVE